MIEEPGLLLQFPGQVAGNSEPNLTARHFHSHGKIMAASICIALRCGYQKAVLTNNHAC